MNVPTVPAAPTERFPTAPLHTLEGHEGAVLALAFNGTGTYCLSCGKDRTLRLWNPHRGTLIKTYTGGGRRLKFDNRALCELNHENYFAQAMAMTCGMWQSAATMASMRFVACLKQPGWDEYTLIHHWQAGNGRGRQEHLFV